MGKYSIDHTTYYNDEGKEIPSVTTILKILDKKELVQWANIMGFKGKRVDDILKVSSTLGTYFHNLVSNDMNGITTVRLLKNEPKDFNILWNRYTKWKGSKTIKPIFSERSYHNKYYGGTIDLLCEMNGRLTLLDFKTSKGIYPSMFLQLGAYMNLILDNDIELGEFIDQAGIVSINKYRVTEKYFTGAEIMKYAKCFNMLANVFYTWFNINEYDWGKNICL